MEKTSQLENYSIISEIGSGSYATVFKAYDKTMKQIVAMKVMNGKSPECISLFKNEVEIMQNIDHPNIAKYYNSFQDEDNCYLIIEYVRGMSILETVNNNGPLDEENAKQLFREIASALKYLHKSGFVHRDIKAENVLIESSGHIKIIDFGFGIRKDDLKKAQPLGSIAYIAPEVIKEMECDEKIDVWSSAVCLYAMLAGELPFFDENSDQMVSKIVFLSPILPIEFSPELKDMMRKMLRKDPLFRPTMEEIMKYDWLSFNKNDNYGFNHMKNNHLKVKCYYQY